MRPFRLILSVLFLTAMPVGELLAEDGSHAGRAVNEASRASGHASGSAAHSIAASGQVTSAIGAVPLAVSGAVLGVAGEVSSAAARGAMEAASAPIGTPLPITEEVVTIQPPNEALKSAAPNPSETRN